MTPPWPEGASGLPEREGRGRGPLAAAQLEPAQAAAATAEDLVEEPREEPLVRPLPERLERERAVPGGVVADRGHAALGDRQLDAQQALEGDDLRMGRRRG